MSDQASALPVILHIPHSSIIIPPAYQRDLLVSRDELAAELLRLTDMYTDEIYDLPGAERAVFPVSRFLVDPERFDDDAQEPMAARGMGAIYTVTTQLTPLRRPPDPLLRAELMERFYKPHHDRLNRWADAALQAQGSALLLDCHSFPSRALPYEQEAQPRPRPEVCIGTDSFHTPLALTEALVEGFSRAGYRVGLNSPFAGALVPSRHYQRSASLFSAMIELRKDIYMDEGTGARLPEFARVKADVTRVMQAAATAVGKVMA